MIATTPDAIIFDMDGTLWDAVHSYCEVWNATYAALGSDRRVGYYDLRPLMGKPLGEIYTSVGAPEEESMRERFMRLLAENEAEMMPRLGGRLYDGAEETLRELRRRGVRLFMVSNCSATGLRNFLGFTGLGDVMEDALSLGATGRDKEMNLRYLRERYNLKSPVYVGDVQSDCDSTHAAGMAFVWAAYGFGDVTGAEARIDSPAGLLAFAGH